jgi:hypothetical protein
MILRLVVMIVGVASAASAEADPPGPPGPPEQYTRDGVNAPKSTFAHTTADYGKTADASAATTVQRLPRSSSKPVSLWNMSHDELEVYARQ